MERKQGFFSALKEEVVRGLSPGRSRSKSSARSGSPISALLRGKKSGSCSRAGTNVANPEVFIARSGSLRPLAGETLAPLIEGPDPDGVEAGLSKRVGLGQWMKVQLSRSPSVVASNSSCPSSNAQLGSVAANHRHRHRHHNRPDLMLLLGIMGAPLAPVHVSSMDPLPLLSIKDTPIVSSYVGTESRSEWAAS